MLINHTILSCLVLYCAVKNFSKQVSKALSVINKQKSQAFTWLYSDLTHY